MNKQVMRITYLFALILLATVQSAFAESAEDWLSHYYKHPAPERFVTEVRALSKLGGISNPESAAPISVFLGRVMAANPTQVDGWLSQLEDLKGEDRQTILFAASLSGTKEAQAYLARQTDAERYRGKPTETRTLELKDTTVLDMLWGDFFATGEAVPVRRIVVALNYAKYSGALDRLAKPEKTEKDYNDALLEVVFKAAMWSLESNARQHQRVGEILEQFYFSGELTRSEQLWLSVILAKAMPDKYELSNPETGQWIFKRKPTVQGRTGWRDSGGKPVADTDAAKCIEGFCAMLIVTSDRDWREKWNTPPKTAPHFTQAKEVEVGGELSILTFLANPKVGPSGMTDVTCDLVASRPDGSKSIDELNVPCFKTKLTTDPANVYLSTSSLKFVVEPTDPRGTWQIKITVKDLLKNIEIPLHTSFVVK